MLILRQKLYFDRKKINPIFRSEVVNTRNLAAKDYRKSMSALNRVMKDGKKPGFFKRLGLGEKKSRLLEQIRTSTGSEKDKLISKYKGLASSAVKEASEYSKEFI